MIKEIYRSQKTMNKVHKDTKRTDRSPRFKNWFHDSSVTLRVMYGDRISTHRNTTNIILIKSTVTYTKKKSSAQHELQPILCKADYMYMGKGGINCENTKIRKEKQIKYNK